MIDIEKIKQAARAAQGKWLSEPAYQRFSFELSPTAVLELITRLESAELFVERTAKAESTLINDLSAYVEVLEVAVQKAKQDAFEQAAAMLDTMESEWYDGDQFRPNLPGDCADAIRQLGKEK